MKNRSFLLATILLCTPLCQAKTKLVVWGLQSGKETKGLDAQVAEFERRNPDIEVSLLSMGAGAMNPQKLLTAIAGGVPPDVINQDRFTIGDWASRDAFRPLDDFLAADKNDPNGIHADEYYPAAWKEAAYKGRVYAIPNGIDDRMMYYNRKILRDAGIKNPPQTWEELLAVAKKLTKHKPDGSLERVGFVPNYGNSWLYLYSWQNGGEFMSPDGRKCTLNNPQSVGALQYMADFYDQLGGYDKVSVFQSGFQREEQDPFFVGDVAMFITGNGFLNAIARYAPGLDFGIAPAPVPAARLRGEGIFKGQSKFVTWSGGFSLAMPRGTKHAKEGWRFIKWMNSLEGTLVSNAAQKKFNESKGRPFVFSFTANKGINEELLRRFPPKGKNFVEGQKAFIEMLPYAKFRPVTFVGQSLWDAHVRAFEQAGQHAKTPQAVMDEQTALVQAELDRAFAREKLPPFPMTPVYAIAVLLLGLVGFGAFNVKKQLGTSKMARSEAIAGYAMVAPWLIGFVLLTAGPILASLCLAFADYDVLHAPRYAGLSNFETLFTSDRELLGKAFYNAAYLAFFGIPLGMATGLSIAMLLNMKVRGMAWYRTAFYIPSIVPAVASAVLWGWILAGDPSKGLLNSSLQSLQAHLPEQLHFALPGWFSVAEWAKPGLIVQGLWGAGGGMILWLAGLQGVPQNLHEAAQIDGARGWGQFRHVTLPLLSPYIFFQLIMGTIHSLQEFDRVYVLGGGSGNAGPLDSLLVPVLFLFNNAFRYFKMGYASAIAWVIFLVILALTLIQLHLQKKWVHYEVEQK